MFDVRVEVFRYNLLHEISRMIKRDYKSKEMDARLRIPIPRAEKVRTMLIF
jgi:hypothetical protein